MGFYCVLLSVIEFYWGLLSYMKFDLELLDFTEFYCFFTELYLVFLGFT